MPLIQPVAPSGLIVDPSREDRSRSRQRFSNAATDRVEVRGKFLYKGHDKFYARGVTYGPFRPDASGSEYHDIATIETDFAQMAALGVNALRTYTVPPRWLLDVAQHYGLRVMIGLPWEQHIAFLDRRTVVGEIERRVRRAVREAAEHPAILGWTIGNEIPSPIVRWLGHRRVERFLGNLYDIAKNEDPGALVTYVNYPSTEYLELPFLDFLSFNVYLEAEQSLHAYVARLQNIAGERPLVMGEIGLDSRRNGIDLQARTLDWQLRTLFAEGCAGVFVFSWTDEWFRGGCEIDDWDFGLMTRERTLKPAAAVVRDVFHQVPFPGAFNGPRISVVICSYNGARTIEHALEALNRMAYPSFEVIVVDDGSTDRTAAIAGEFGIRLIQQENQGLSAARNTGWNAARGQIVAYLDDDAAPDPQWLDYLAHAFHSSSFAGIAGPNISFPEDGFLAQCVDHSPGNPTHVLVTDREAEHLPGCNMAYRRECLAAVAGFDPLFRIAGDDVDLCWRLEQAGLKLGFHPAAMVWHHRRATVRSYWRQQYNYGRAEGMLERKWPEKYNAAGHLAWNGRLYDKSFCRFLRSGPSRIYHGSWGTALFQHVYHPAPGGVQTFLMMPDWYLITGLIAAVLSTGVFNVEIRFALFAWMLVILLPAFAAVRAGLRMHFHHDLRQRHSSWTLAAATALLHWLQPIARAGGRLREGLTPWRRRGGERLVLPRSRHLGIWSETPWRGAEDRLAQLEAAMRREGAVVARGGDWDVWDLEARGGMFGSARLKLAIEEHGAGRQLVRIHVAPRTAWLAVSLTVLILLLTIEAGLEQREITAGVLGSITLLMALRMIQDSGSAVGVAVRAVRGGLGAAEKIVDAPKE